MVKNPDILSDNKSLITGIDEAGRGAVIGPLVIAGVTIDKKYEGKLKSIGVKDSKELSPKKREELAKKIEEIASNIVIMRVQPCRIDDMRAKGINLDRIEAMKMAEIVEMTSGGTVYIDSLTANCNKFKQVIVKCLKNNNCELIVENYLDESIPAVSAASIIAKVSRDEAIKEIELETGHTVGVGYPHDERTIQFVEKLIKERGKDLPPYVRRSWVTTQVLQEKNWQRKLKDFIFGKKEKCKEDME
jgi:ribonuclease HII